MKRKKLTAVFMALGMAMVCFSGCGRTGNGISDPTATPAPTVKVSVTPKATETPKSDEAESQGGSGSQSQSSSSSQNGSTAGDSQAESSNQESAAEEEHEIQYISGNIRSFGDGTITIEYGESGNYYDMVLFINDAEMNIDNGSSVRSGLNVDLEYYVEDGVNMVTVLSSDGIEYLSPSAQEEAERLAEESDTGESENYDSDYVSEDSYTDESEAADSGYESTDGDVSTEY